MSEVTTWVHPLTLYVNRLKEFIKEQLISIPPASLAPQPVPQQAPPNPPIAQSDPGAMLAALL